MIWTYRLESIGGIYVCEMLCDLCVCVWFAVTYTITIWMRFAITFQADFLVKFSLGWWQVNIAIITAVGFSF